MHGIAIVVLLLSPPDATSEKRQLARDLLKVIDVKQLTQTLVDVNFEKMLEPAAGASGMTPEQHKDYLGQIEEQRAMMSQFRERLYPRLDYARLEEFYVPYFEKTFTADELRTLIAFYKTKEGQQLARLMPELSIRGLLKSMEQVNELSGPINAELEREKKNR